MLPQEEGKRGQKWLQRKPDGTFGLTASVTNLRNVLRRLVSPVEDQDGVAVLPFSPVHDGAGLGGRDREDGGGGGHGHHQDQELVQEVFGCERRGVGEKQSCHLALKNSRKTLHCINCEH